jgi:hypothetical protein
MGNSTISIVIFNSFLYVYQRVPRIRPKFQGSPPGMDFLEVAMPTAPKDFLTVTEVGPGPVRLMILGFPGFCLRWFFIFPIGNPP